MLSLQLAIELIEQSMSERLHQAMPKLEPLALSKVCGRVLARDVLSPIDLPRFAVSAMDGYGIRLENLPAVNQYNIVGESIAGKSFVGELFAGQAIRIMTGAPVPACIDTIIMRENVIQSFGQNQMRLIDDFVPKLGANIRQKGEEIKQNELLLSTGRVLTPADVMLLASVGIAHIDAYERIKVGVMSTGDELVQAGTSVNPDQIYDCNRPALLTLLSQLPVDVIDLGCIHDNKEALSNVLTHASARCDVLMSSGAVSVGDYDFLTTILESLGEIKSHKVAIKPGKPFMFGKIGNACFFGLPGNPLATFIGFLVLVEPALWKLAGANPVPQPLSLNAKLSHPIRNGGGRVDFQRGLVTKTESGDLMVTPIGSQDSHRVKGLSDANALIVLPANQNTFTADQTVSVLLLPNKWL